MCDYLYVYIVMRDYLYVYIVMRDYLYVYIVMCDYLYAYILMLDYLCLFLIIKARKKTNNLRYIAQLYTLLYILIMRLSLKNVYMFA